MILSTSLLILGIGLISHERSPSLEESSLKNLELKKGILLSISAAIFWDLAIMTADYILKVPGVDVFSLATLRYGLETLLLIFLWIIFDKYQLNVKKIKPFKSFSRGDIVILGLVGILNWGIGAVSFFSSMELIGSARTTPISSISPLIAVILGMIFLRKKFSSLQAFGILLVCLATIFVSFF